MLLTVCGAEAPPAKRVLRLQHGAALEAASPMLLTVCGAGARPRSGSLRLQHGAALEAASPMLSAPAARPRSGVRRLRPRPVLCRALPPDTVSDVGAEVPPAKRVPPAPARCGVGGRVPDAVGSCGATTQWRSPPPVLARCYVGH